jgi:hypothetical protein
MTTGMMLRVPQLHMVRAIDMKLSNKVCMTHITTTITTITRLNKHYSPSIRATSCTLSTGSALLGSLSTLDF